MFIRNTLRVPCKTIVTTYNIDRGNYMSGHVIWDLLHKLLENEKNKPLPSFYHFLITSEINPV